MKIELELTGEELQHLLSFANNIDKDDIEELLEDMDYAFDYVEGCIVEPHSADVMDTVFWKIFDQIRPLKMFDKHNDDKPILQDDLAVRTNSGYREGR